MTPPTLFGIELLVEDLPAAVDVLTTGFGCVLVWEGRSNDVDADVAVLDAGPITITLLAVTETGGVPLPDASPRLTQIVFGAGRDTADSAVETLRDMGVAVAAPDSVRPHVPPGIAKGILGSATALVLTIVPPGADDAAPEHPASESGDG